MQADTPDREQLYIALRGKPDLKDFLEMVQNDPAILPILLDIIQTDAGSTKFYCEKGIRYVSEQSPALLVPYFAEIAKMLESPNHFIQWGSIVTMSNLTVADDGGRFAGIYETYFSLIQSENMVGVANVIRNAWKIVRRYPEWEQDITRRMLRVRENTYYYDGKPSPECNNVLYGHMLYCFDQYFSSASDLSRENILAFATAQIENPRKAVAKAAGAFMKKHAALSGGNP